MISILKSDLEFLQTNYNNVTSFTISFSNSVKVGVRIYFRVVIFVYGTITALGIK